jgi:hypothetical protein
VIAEMMDYPSLTHFQARKLSPERLAQLTPTERLERTAAQKRLSNARLRPTKTFAYPAAELPTPRRDSHRDYLDLTDPDRDIIRV